MKRQIVLVLIMAVAAGATACQKTPEGEVVMSKKDEDFQKLIMQKADGKETEYPASCQDSFISKDEKVNFFIDADVTVHGIDKYPVFTIKPVPFTDEITRKCADVFLEGGDGYYSLGTLTKSELAEEIIKIQARLADEEGLREFCGDEKTYERVCANHEKSLAYYQGKMQEAPEEKLELPTEFIFQPLEFYLDERRYSQYSAEQEMKNRVNPNESGNEYLIADSVLSDGRFARFRVSNERSQTFIENSAYGDERYQIMLYRVPTYVGLSYLYIDDPFYMSSSDGDISALFPQLTLTEDEALAIAGEALSDMGAEYFYLMSSWIEKEKLTYEENEQVWGLLEGSEEEYRQARDELEAGKPEIFYVFEFRPEYFGVPFIPSSSRYIPEETYNSSIENEKIRMRVSNDGVIYFSWVNPIQTINVVNDNVKLMPFDEILESARKRMKLSYNLIALAPLDYESDIDAQLDKYEQANMYIYEIELGLTRIPVYNKPGEYMMIPVWNFYGYYDLIGKAEQDTYMTDTDDDYFSRYQYPLVTVNAIDGSIIKEIMLHP